MKFIQEIKKNIQNKDDEFIITLLSSGNKKGNLHGYRAEAPHPLITLNNYQLRFNYIPKKIHPDLLALICVVIFYPFFCSDPNQIQDDLSFPKPVSKKFAQELKKLPLYTVDTDNQYKSQKIGINLPEKAIDPLLRPYRPKGASLLSFGGGLDSVATYSLFPNTIIVHEQESGPSKDYQKSGETGTEHLIKKLNSKNRYFIIETNSKFLATPNGWTGWISCIATSLLIATELGATNIVLGSSLGSIIGSCRRFIQEGYEFPMNSIWARLLEDGVGIKLITPILGLSELALIRLIDPSVLDHIIWCDKNKGYPCRACSKCFRRYLLLHDYRGDLKMVNWNEYNNLSVYVFLRDRKKQGPTMTYLLDKYKNDLPNWIVRYQLDNDSKKVDEKFDLLAWYHRSLCYLPESLRIYTYKRIAPRVRPMRNEEMDEFERLYG